MIPIVFAFDNNLTLPAAVCIYSLFCSAKADTIYDVHILFRRGHKLDTTFIKKIFKQYPQHRLKLIEVDGRFDSSFEIRGITTAAYYRLLIPILIPEYDKVIYSDVDVIFRQDLSEVYKLDLTSYIVAGVNNLAHIDNDLRNHYEGTLGLDPNKIICSGFLVMNLAAIRKENIHDLWLELSKNNYKFQDQDVINISCAGRIRMLDPKFSLLTYINHYALKSGKNVFLPLWNEAKIDEALKEGNIHYNGAKPWKGWCLNFDIWWEYYRKSPIFDEKFYFDFYFHKLDEYDRLSLTKRIKILARYILHGQRKD